MAVHGEESIVFIYNIYDDELYDEQRLSYIKEMI